MVPIKYKRRTYRMSDQGRRLLELSESLSDEEAKHFLRVARRQLDVLRTIFKQGPKRRPDFPYDARYCLKRMVDRGFLNEIVRGVDIEELRRMRDEGLPNREIAQKLGVSVPAVYYWVKKLNLDRRNPRQIRMKRRNSVYQLLKRNGPMARRNVMEALGFSIYKIEKALSMFPEDFQKITFPGAVRTKYGSKFRDLIKASPVLSLKGDPRIVDFAASHIHLKVETRYHAKSVVHLLKWQIGHRQAREVVERLGYRYKAKPHH